MKQEHFVNKKRLLFFIIVLVLYLLLPKQTYSVQGGVSLRFPGDWIWPFNQLSNTLFISMQFLQKWTIKNLLFFSFTLFLLSFLPETEKMKSGERKVWIAIFLVTMIVIGGFGLYMIIGVFAIGYNRIYTFMYELFTLHEQVVSVIWVWEAVILDRILKK